MGGPLGGDPFPLQKQSPSEDDLIEGVTRPIISEIFSSEIITRKWFFIYRETLPPHYFPLRCFSAGERANRLLMRPDEEQTFRESSVRAGDVQSLAPTFLKVRPPKFLGKWGRSDENAVS